MRLGRGSRPRRVECRATRSSPQRLASLRCPTIGQSARVAAARFSCSRRVRKLVARGATARFGCSSRVRNLVARGGAPNSGCDPRTRKLIARATASKSHGAAPKRSSSLFCHVNPMRRRARLSWRPARPFTLHALGPARLSWRRPVPPAARDECNSSRARCGPARSLCLRWARPVCPGGGLFLQQPATSATRSSRARCGPALVPPAARDECNSIESRSLRARARSSGSPRRVQLDRVALVAGPPVHSACAVDLCFVVHLVNTVSCVQTELMAYRFL